MRHDTTISDAVKTTVSFVLWAKIGQIALMLFLSVCGFGAFKAAWDWWQQGEVSFWAVPLCTLLSLFSLLSLIWVWWHNSGRSLSQRGWTSFDGPTILMGPTTCGVLAVIILAYAQIKPTDQVVETPLGPVKVHRSPGEEWKRMSFPDYDQQMAAVWLKSEQAKLPHLKAAALPAYGHVTADYCMLTKSEDRGDIMDNPQKAVKIWLSELDKYQKAHPDYISARIRAVVSTATSNVTNISYAQYLQLIGENNQKIAKAKAAYKSSMDAASNREELHKAAENGASELNILEKEQKSIIERYLGLSIENNEIDQFMRAITAAQG